MKRINKTWISKILVISLVLAGVGMQIAPAYAIGGITEFSDNLSNLTQGAVANHEIFFKTTSGLASGQSMTLTYSANWTLGSIAFGDMDLAEESSGAGACSTRTYTEKTLVASSATSSQFNASKSGQVVTFQSGGASATITATKCVRIRIGTNAVSGGTGTNQITNPASAGSDTLALSINSGTDTGTADIAVIANSQVVVTATVNPSLTFSISANSITFGALDAADDRFADTSTGSSTTTTAHTLIAGTNATSGYIIYLLGATLTSGVNTITAPAGPSATTVGSEQFGLHITDGGGGTGVTVDSQYGTSSQYGWGSTASVQDNIASASTTTASNTFNASYVANIASNTEAGAYTTTLTYTATASF